MSRARFPLLRVQLASLHDLVTLRHLVREAARGIGMPTTDITRVATSISELGRLAVEHPPVTIDISLAPDRTSLDVTFRFQGDGPPSGVRVGEAVHTVVSRLMDRVSFRGADVTVSKVLTTIPDAATLTRTRDALLVDPPGVLRTVLESQNAELVSALLTLRERESELVALNVELAETNRGVVALYTELEQRAAEVRSAHRLVFEELGSALRPSPPVLAGVEFGVRYLPAQLESPTGGDLYDWLVLPDGSIHIAVVDVMGHGAAGTRDALSVTHVLRTLTLEGHGLDHLFERADRILQTTATKVVATAVVARFDPVLGVLDVAGAGHPPALRLPVAGGPVYLDTTGRPFGYPGAGLGAVVSTRLEPGDCFVAYTDGLIEIRRDVIEGLSTLSDAAGYARGLPVQQLLDAILQACTRGDALRDDTLLLAMRWTPATRSDATAEPVPDTDDS